MQQIGFLLQNLLFSQHVSGTIMPIIRSSRVIQMAAPCGSCLFGLRVVGLCAAVGYVSGMRDAALEHPPQVATTCTVLLSS